MSYIADGPQISRNWTRYGKWPKGTPWSKAPKMPFGQKKEITSFSLQVPLRALLVLQRVLQLLLLVLQLLLLELFLQLKSKPGMR